MTVGQRPPAVTATLEVKFDRISEHDKATLAEFFGRKSTGWPVPLVDISLTRVTARLAGIHFDGDGPSALHLEIKAEGFEINGSDS